MFSPGWGATGFGRHNLTPCSEAADIALMGARRQEELLYLIVFS